MQAVVTMLDDASCALVQLLWEGIEHEFGIQTGFANPIPHFTYHVAESYDWKRLRDVLWHASHDHKPFRIHAGGLGLFTGNKLVIHVPLVRNPALNALQGGLWTDLRRVGTGVVQHFHPELWIPHLTLARNGLTPELLPVVVKWLAERSYTWDVRVDHLGLIEESGNAGELAHRFRLTGP